jgi:hypothetical protein
MVNIMFKLFFPKRKKSEDSIKDSINEETTYTKELVVNGITVKVSSNTPITTDHVHKDVSGAIKGVAGIINALAFVTTPKIQHDTAEAELVPQLGNDQEHYWES